MPQPQPGTLNYIVFKRISTSVRVDEVTLLISDGTTARIITDKVSKSTTLSNIPHNRLVQLWQLAISIEMKVWRAANQRHDDNHITDSVDEILRVFSGNATPDIEDIITAARTALTGTGKLDDYQKMNTMLQGLNEVQLRRFISFMFIILLSKSAGE